MATHRAENLSNEKKLQHRKKTTTKYIKAQAKIISNIAKWREKLARECDCKREESLGSHDETRKLI